VTTPPDRFFDRSVSSENATRLMTAFEVAELLAVSRYFVYEHQRELGAVKLGEGKRAAIRFPPERIAEVRASGFGNRAYREPEDRVPERKAATRRRRRTGSGGDLLPVGAREAAERRRR
jgi:predicted DNA-binding transcriptional regulator AlpA